jgi:hypothetical protein
MDTASTTDSLSPIIEMDSIFPVSQIQQSTLRTASVGPTANASRSDRNEESTRFSGDDYPLTQLQGSQRRYDHEGTQSQVVNNRDIGTEHSQHGQPDEYADGRQNQMENISSNADRSSKHFSSATSGSKHTSPPIHRTGSVNNVVSGPASHDTQLQHSQSTLSR